MLKPGRVLAKLLMYHLQGLVVALNCELPPKHVGVEVLTGKYNGQGVLFLRWHTWSQCQLGFYLQRQWAFPPVLNKHPAPFGRHRPVQSLVLFCHSTGEAGLLSWRSGP